LRNQRTTFREPFDDHKCPPLPPSQDKFLSDLVDFVANDKFQSMFEGFFLEHATKFSSDEERACVFCVFLYRARCCLLILLSSPHPPSPTNR
jgi:hypothetical protein